MKARLLQTLFFAQVIFVEIIVAQPIYYASVSFLFRLRQNSRDKKRRLAGTASRVSQSRPSASYLFP